MRAPLPTFHDSDEESTEGDGRDTGERTELSESSKALITGSFASSLSNSERRKIRAQFPHSGLPQTRCPKLDAVFKSAPVKTETKTADAELGKIQALVLDPVGPLLHLIERLQNEDEELTTEDAVASLHDALRLVGNASCQISTIRRKKVLKALNPEIQDLAAEEEHFREAAPQLFGNGFEKVMKDRAESIKILQKASKTSLPQQQKKLFSKRPLHCPPKRQRPEPWQQEGQPAVAAETPNCQQYHQVNPVAQDQQTLLGRDLPLCVSKIILLKNILVKRGGIRSPEVTISQIAGRLALIRDNWEKVTQDQWVLDVVTGYRIEFLSPPTQMSSPRVGVCSSEEQRLINEEISKMLSKGAITELPLEEAHYGFYSSLFLVPKKDGGVRPVINLKSLNEYVVPQHFKMEGIHTLKDLVRRGDWMTKIDLKDAYFMIPIHSTSRSVLRFSTEQHLYEFSCLPFGLSCAPWVFTKTLKPALTLLRELGVRLVAYIDDILVLAETEEIARNHT